MKKLKAIAAVAFLTAAVAVKSFWPDASNRYERAQRQTVLLTLPDGQGSGVVVRRESIDGVRLFVWTAAHVVQGHRDVEVGYFIRHQGRRVGKVNFKARVIASDARKDIALLWLDAPAHYFGAAEFDTDEDRIGETQYHVGNFLGKEFDASVSTGVLSQTGVRPELEGWPWPDALDQTTCVATYGSSGGPIFNARTEKIEGILVGGMVGRGFINYVPTREIVKWAKDKGVSWAVANNICPSDALLEKLVIPATPVLPPAVSILCPD